MIKTFFARWPTLKRVIMIIALNGRSIPVRFCHNLDDLHVHLRAAIIDDALSNFSDSLNKVL